MLSTRKPSAQAFPDAAFRLTGSFLQKSCSSTLEYLSTLISLSLVLGGGYVVTYKLRISIR